MSLAEIVIEQVDNRINYGEERIVCIGLSKLLKEYPTVVVIIYIEKIDKILRIISARKALKHEQEFYYKAIFQRKYS